MLDTVGTESPSCFMLKLTDVDTVGFDNVCVFYTPAFDLLICPVMIRNRHNIISLAVLCLLNLDLSRNEPTKDKLGIKLGDRWAAFVRK